MGTHIHSNTPVSRLLRFRLSFQPFIHYLKKNRPEAGSSRLMSDLVDYLINRLMPFPDFSQTDSPPADAERLKEIFELIAFSILPMTRVQADIAYAFGLPDPIHILHRSPAFERMVRDSPDLLREIKADIDPVDHLRFGYRQILEKAYHVQGFGNDTAFFTFQKRVDGLTKFYRTHIDTTFITLHWEGELPPLQEAWVNFAWGLRQTVDDLPTSLPLEHFTGEGFGFFWIEDVTESETIQQLREVFTHLQSDTEPIVYSRFESGLRNYLFQPDLQVGLFPLVQINDHLVHAPDFTRRSIFFKHAGERLEFETLQRLKPCMGKKPLPIIVPSLADIPADGMPIDRPHNIQSFILYPIIAGDNILGVLEIGSPHANALNEQTEYKLEAIVPLVRELLLYQRNQFMGRIQATIRNQFTSLQPAVEWKFYEAAWSYLRDNEKQLPAIHFPDVFPLYGAIDIRNSSSERNNAIQQDLVQQLAAVDALLAIQDQAGDPSQSDPLRQDVRQWQHQVANGLSPDADADLTYFLTQEVSTYLQRIQVPRPVLREKVQAYFTQLDPTSGLFTEHLQAFEQSHAWLNATLEEYLDSQQKNLQAIYPNYFEKFRTDGMEYTLYAGQSIAPQKPFSEEDLQHLRRWQLVSMVEMAQLSHRIQPHLSLPLRTTQLILVHKRPVTIGFRRNERRFDVEGSYSIRYEVIKKRIDKASIKGSTERLTKPDTIALVYANKRELADYLPIIDELQQTGRLGTALEYLDLEPLQGITRLKAVRLAINYAA
ncbi:GAF domain-containing protein [Spirosoma sp. KUDC1026]|uniref:GAF domain-containing protein n=1 Tax=Spirosoma sp. KUDC1026 TaxID=2745947 RepID=UPI00159BE6B1|nr:GAF domain-containing protein [Spirosoma sp. KUDC1026]QKZ14974.1 GAF domain-containing protein [Spirosoma sp. KUDC1026]